MLFSLQGTLIFLAAVAFRKRAIKGFIKHGDKACLGCLRPIIPESLRTATDEEGTTDCDEELDAEEGGAAVQQNLRN